LQAFGGSSVAPRVQALLADPLPGPSRARVTLAAIAFGVVAALLAEPLHHVTEHGLERLLALL
jgi:hypothetical protein